VFRGPGFAITAVGVVNCLGRGPGAVWEALKAGASGLRRVRLFDDVTEQPYEGIAGQVEPTLLVTGGDAMTTRQALLAVTAAEQVRGQVLAARERWGRDRLGFVLGTSTGGIAASERAYAYYRRHGTIAPDYSFEEQHAFDAIARQLARDFDLHGPCYVVSTACSSSAKALGAAGRLIAGGVADAVLVGGVDSLCLTTLLGFQSLGVVDPQGCRPFARDRGGISIGEGAAFLLIERDAAAPAYLLSVGETSDAHHMAHPHPEGIGAELAMRQALEAAGIDARSIGYVNAHGTGTVANDDVEASAIARVLGTGPLVSSTKAFTGHLLGACGATEALFCAQAIEHQLAPGNGGTDPSAGLGISLQPRAFGRRIDYALSNSLAFGGSNASVLLASRDGLARHRSSAPHVSGRADQLRAELVRAVSWSAERVARDPGAGLLSARTRARSSQLTLMFADVLEQLVQDGFDAQSSPIVFGSAYGEMGTTLKLLQLEIESGESSPIRFQLSVHNAAAGLLSIASGNRGFSTSIAAGPDTFAMSMLEAIVYLNHGEAREIAVLVADECSVPELSRTQHAPMAAGFRLRRLAPNASTATWVLHAPKRVAEAQPSAVGSSRRTPAELNNPVSDAFKLVDAFEAKTPGVLRLGAGPAAGDLALGWALELTHLG